MYEELLENIIIPMNFDSEDEQFYSDDSEDRPFDISDDEYEVKTIINLVDSPVNQHPMDMDHLMKRNHEIIRLSRLRLVRYPFKFVGYSCEICKGKDGLSSQHIYHQLNLDWCIKCQVDMVPNQISVVRKSLLKQKFPEEIIELMLDILGWYNHLQMPFNMNCKLKHKRN